MLKFITWTVTRTSICISCSANILSQANSAFHPSGVGKWGPASAGKEKAGMVYSVSGWTCVVQVTLRDPLRTSAIPERLRGLITTRLYTEIHVYLTLLYLSCTVVMCGVQVDLSWTSSVLSFVYHGFHFHIRKLWQQNVRSSPGYQPLSLFYIQMMTDILYWQPFVWWFFTLTVTSLCCQWCAYFSEGSSRDCWSRTLQRMRQHYPLIVCPMRCSTGKD